MLHILGFIFFIVLIVLVLGLALLSKVIRTVLGVGRRMGGQRASDFNGRQNSSASNAQGNFRQNVHTDAQPRNGRKKVFDDDEGEYVDFEEIKE